jgi:DNA-binding winged helix-turn-helix (wHTH) protein
MSAALRIHRDRRTVSAWPSVWPEDHLEFLLRSALHPVKFSDRDHVEVRNLSMTQYKSFEIGGIEIDSAANTLKCADKVVRLEPRLMEVLCRLASRPGEVLSRLELLEGIWRDADTADEALTQAISKIRRALADDPLRPTFIETVSKRGYRMIAPVAPVGVRGAMRAMPENPVGKTSKKILHVATQAWLRSPSQRQFILLCAAGLVGAVVTVVAMQLFSSPPPVRHFEIETIYLKK